jgi:hypothetical protein
MSSPRTVPSPSVVWMRPRIVFKNVDFPAPFGPSNPVAPLGTDKLSLFKATCGPYDLVKFVVLMMRSSCKIYSLKLKRVETLFEVYLGLMRFLQNSQVYSATRFHGYTLLEMLHIGKSTLCNSVSKKFTFFIDDETGISW